MFAISALDHATVLRFEGLAPFEVRPLLYDLAALERVHMVGATLMGKPIGLGVAVRGWAPNVSLPEGATPAFPARNAARVISLTVSRNYRRLGVGSALLQALENTLASFGISVVTGSFAPPEGEGREAVEGLLRKADWESPQVTMVQCKAEHALLDAPIMREQMVLPPDYSVVDWVELSDDDRASIAQHKGEPLWHSDALDPFHFEPDMEVRNSLALRYHGEVVGWLITTSTSPNTMYYRCMFVRADLARLGRGLALIAQAVLRQASILQGAYGYGEWSTPMSLPLMIRFIRKHLAPFGATVTEQCVACKHLPCIAGEAADAIAVSRAISIAPPAATNVQPVQLPNVLIYEECDRACNAILSLRDQWIERVDTLPSFTIGAVAASDLSHGVAHYEREAVRLNPLLESHFAAMLDKLHMALGKALGTPVQQREGWAVPALRVRGTSAGSHLPIASIACDVAFQYLARGMAHERRPLSFALCLSVDSADAGLRTWSLDFAATVGLDTEEKSRLLDTSVSEFHPLERGSLLLWPSTSYRQWSPIVGSSDAQLRITLEGHLLFSQGKWLVFG